MAKLSPKFKAVVRYENNVPRIALDNGKQYEHYLSSFAHNTAIFVTVERRSNKRSRRQNSFYWGAVLPTISDHTGHTEQELHEAFKKLFLPRKLFEVNGKKVYLTGSTSELSTGAMSEYIMRIAAECAELGIVLPDPKDYNFAPTL